jgi:hypothetical protein
MKTLKIYYSLTVLVFSGLIFTSCEDLWNRCVEGNGIRTSDSRPLQSFTRVEVNGDFEVQIDTGNVSSAIIEADENLIELIVTHVSGSKLIIETRNDACIKPTHPIEISVNTTALEEIILNGSGYVYNYGLKTQNLSVNLTGSGKVDCNNAEAQVAKLELEGSGSINAHMNSENLTTTLEGSGEIKVTGVSVYTDHKIIGSGHIIADEVDCDVSVVYISGSGIVDTRADNALDVTIIGSGTVYYRGNPTVSSYISGSGKVIKR